MKKIVFPLLLAASACGQYEGFNKESQVGLSFFDHRGNGQRRTLGVVTFSDEVVCPKPQLITEMREEKAAGIETALVAVLANQLTKAVVSETEKWKKSFTATYSTSVNLKIFNIGEEAGQTKCVGIFRVGPGPEKKDTLLSAIVFELKSVGNKAMFVSPVYMYIPHLKAPTTLNSEQIGQADVAVTVAFSTVNGDRELVSHSQSFSARSYQSTVTSGRKTPTAGVKDFRNGKKPSGYDTALMPYFPGQPVTMSVAVSEVGAGAKDAGALADAVSANKKVIHDLISGTLTGALD